MVEAPAGDEPLPSEFGSAEELQPIQVETETPEEVVQEATTLAEQPVDEQPLDEAIAIPESLTESFEIPEDAEFVTVPEGRDLSADGLVEVPDFSDGEGDDEDGERKAKKSKKKRTLVLDEESGEMVAVRRRKPNRIRGWDIEDEGLD